MLKVAAISIMEGMYLVKQMIKVVIFKNKNLYIFMQTMDTKFHVICVI